ncbi:MAG TPA: hypothetical protein VKT77_19330 [Chthonomonadaceae bacterium]|nr:hypothetical protein [Chthonomonadaceae bacterium]
MPLSEKARIEVYIPDLPSPAYDNLLDTLEQEFTYTFGGCSTIRGMHGSYLSNDGYPVKDRVNLIYTDARIRFDANLSYLSRFTDRLRQAASEALDEEAVLVAAYKILHST